MYGTDAGNLCQHEYTALFSWAARMSHVLRLAGHDAHVSHVSTNRERTRHSGWSLARGSFLFPALPFPFFHLWLFERLDVATPSGCLPGGTRLGTTPPLHNGSTGATSCQRIMHPWAGQSRRAAQRITKGRDIALLIHEVHDARVSAHGEGLLRKLN